MEVPWHKAPHLTTAAPQCLHPHQITLVTLSPQQWHRGQLHHPSPIPLFALSCSTSVSIIDAYYPQSSLENDHTDTAQDKNDNVLARSLVSDFNGKRVLFTYKGSKNNLLNS